MAYSRRSEDSDREYVLMPVKSVHGGSEYGGRGRRHHDLPIEVNNFLEVPQGRPRAASQGGGVAPAIINIGGDALSVRDGRERGHSRSRSRHRDYHHHRYHRDGSCSSSSYSSDRSRSRHRHRDDRGRRPSKKDPIDEEDLPYKFRKELDFARAQHREEDERRIMDRIKKDREADRKRWKQEEEEEERRKRKEKEAILMEAKLEKERKDREAEELRKKILKDEEERKEKEKQKKKAEEEEFERKVKEKFMNAGTRGPYFYGRYPGCC
jgi:flagellar biosynthesis GTPase FlhF